MSTKLFALCLASESNQAHEWKYIAWVVKLRILSPRYPNSAKDVILQPKQFSYFNNWTGKGMSNQEVIDEAVKGYAGQIFVKWENDLVQCAERVISAPLWESPFPLDTLHYYSPVSMKPKGSSPAWKSSARLLITPSGVDPQRFVFAAGVA